MSFLKKQGKEHFRRVVIYIALAMCTTYPLGWALVHLGESSGLSHLQAYAVQMLPVAVVGYFVNRRLWPERNISGRVGGSRYVLVQTLGIASPFFYAYVAHPHAPQWLAYSLTRAIFSGSSYIGAHYWAFKDETAPRDTT